MSFFEEIPEPEIRVEMRSHRQPEWAGPPENMVGSTVPAARAVELWPDDRPVGGDDDES